jgi:hypothetical protein
MRRSRTVVETVLLLNQRTPRLPTSMVMRLAGRCIALLLLVAGQACLADEIRPSPSDARPSMPYAGTATMQDDGSLTLHLRRTRDGKEIDDSLTYKTTDRGYDDVLRHLGGLSPGDTKDFRPWKD